MAHRVWIAKVDGVERKIELEHNLWSGERRLLVDGWEVHKGRRLLDLGEDIRFAIAGQWGLVRIAPRGVAYTYRLALNDLWTDDWTLISARPRLAALAGYALLAHALALLVLGALGSTDPGSFLVLVGTRVLVSAFLALQVLGGARWGWYGALAYAVVTLAIGLMSAGAAVSGTALDRPGSGLPADLRSPLGLAVDVLVAVGVGAALLQPPVRLFFLGAPRKPATVAP